jgi:dTDP-glucose 4,6-dehydratase
MRNLLIAGGAGFIGSNYARLVLRERPSYRVVVFDKLTYAGNPDNLRDLAPDPRFHFVQGDICDAAAVESVLAAHAIDTIVNFAAESHVDRSLMDPGAFVQTDVYGAFVLLEAARRHGLERYLQISTDEVYGHVPAGSSTEADPLAPRSPYSASKAGADFMVLAYHVSHSLPALVTRASNNIGPYQHPEKVVPLFVTSALDHQPLPLYGDGRQVRDWLFVEDHCRAIDLALHKGQPGEVYNVGGDNERENIEVARRICDLLGRPHSLITPVADRPGHDRRYALDSAKLKALGYRPEYDFDRAMETTVAWYRANEWWWRKIKSGEFAAYYQRQYGARLASAR